ncbi:hypothetical protein TNCV_1558821 [Trichonephila clavipes]|nr:hypothetical protein TNCV_1558821 [Trichonephila clavipes]
MRLWIVVLPLQTQYIPRKLVSLKSPPQPEAPSFDERNSTWNLILPTASKSKRQFRDLLLAAQLYNKDAVDFLQHENQPTWAGVEPAPKPAPNQPRHSAGTSE